MAKDFFYRLSSKVVYILFAFLALFILIFYYSQFFDLVFERYFGSDFFSRFLPSIVDTVLLVFGAFFFLLVTKPLIRYYFVKKGRDSQAGLLVSFYSYFVWFIAFALILSTVFKDLGTLIASLGLIGFGFTLALQKPILNFVGWLNIIMTNPFNVGERIEVSGIIGEVISIHTMFTRIKGLYKTSQSIAETLITIPNEVLLTNPVLNYSRLGGIVSDDLTISITYESNWKKARQIIEEVAEETMRHFIKAQLPATFAEKRSWQEALSLLQEASKRIKRGFLKKNVSEQIEIIKTAKETLSVPFPKSKLLISLGQSSIDINVVYKTDLHLARDSKDYFTRRILEEFSKHSDLEFAYPHMQIVSEDKKAISKNNKKILDYG